MDHHDGHTKHVHVGKGKGYDSVDGLQADLKEYIERNQIKDEHKQMRFFTLIDRVMSDFRESKLTPPDRKMVRQSPMGTFLLSVSGLMGKPSDSDTFVVWQRLANRLRVIATDADGRLTSASVRRKAEKCEEWKASPGRDYLPKKDLT